jgi:hypothetical protein
MDSKPPALWLSPNAGSDGPLGVSPIPFLLGWRVTKRHG